MTSRMICKLCKKPIGSNGFCRDCLTYSGVEESSLGTVRSYSFWRKRSNEEFRHNTKFPKVSNSQRNVQTERQLRNLSGKSRIETKNPDKNTRYVPKKIPKYICPYCKEEFNSSKEISEHLTK